MRPHGAIARSQREDRFAGFLCERYQAAEVLDRGNEIRIILGCEIIRSRRIVQDTP